jgi:hypothetical protein
MTSVNTISGLLAEAADGVGISYWAEVCKVTRDDEDNVISFVVKDGAPDGQPLKKGTRTINERSIKQAREAMVNGDSMPRRDIAAQFVGKPEDWEYDSEGVDAIVQTALFGAIVYG